MALSVKFVEVKGRLAVHRQKPASEEGVTVSIAGGRAGMRTTHAVLFLEMV